jgi:hypothetical protein
MGIRSRRLLGKRQVGAAQETKTRADTRDLASLGQAMKPAPLPGSLPTIGSAGVDAGPSVIPKHLPPKDARPWQPTRAGSAKRPAQYALDYLLPRLGRALPKPAAPRKQGTPKRSSKSKQLAEPAPAPFPSIGEREASREAESRLGQPLGIAAVAELIGCSPWTVRQTLIPRGLPVFRSAASGKLIFYTNQVVRWIERQQQGGI